MHIPVLERGGDGRAGTAISVVGRPAAQHTIMSGEHVAQLGHTTTQRRGRLDQADLQSRFCQVHGRAHAGHAAANDHYRVLRVAPGGVAVVFTLYALHRSVLP
jgi:hypothetical protein